MAENPENNRQPAALVFDCDGTLVDTMPGHYIAWERTLARYDLKMSEARFYELGGVPTERIAAMLAEEAGISVDAAAVAHEKELAYYDLSDHIGEVAPVVAIARAYRGKLPMAVATGSVRESAVRSLTKIGVADWFDAIVTADDVARPKPSPDVFLEAARRLNIAPEACRAYEDTDLGIESARRAGMEVVDVRPMVGR